MPSISIANARIVTLTAPGDSDSSAPPGTRATASASATGSATTTARALPGPRRGRDMRHLGVIERGFIRITDGRIVAVGEGSLPDGFAGEIIDADGCVLMPAFVDCHTHACWAGSRLDEFERRLEGAPYLDILKSGGGIMSTVRAVREASVDELTGNLLRRLGAMAAMGAGAVEVKTGYGLTTEHELNMLRAIHQASSLTPQTMVGTFLGAHAIDPTQPNFVETVINETLPAVVNEFPHITCDAFCEEGAWSLNDCRRLFAAAIDLGCPIRVHTDQFKSLGMTKLAIEMGAVSVDHLEAITPADITLLGSSQTIAVALPACGFHLDDRYAPGRAIIDAGGALALATNYNPGSAPCPSMGFIVALAVRKLGITPAEAITAATYNAACVLGIQQSVGTIEVGRQANLQLLEARDERELAFEFATPGPLLVMVAGQIVHTRGLARQGE